MCLHSFSFVALPSCRPHTRTSPPAGGTLKYPHKPAKELSAIEAEDRRAAAAAASGTPHRGSAGSDPSGADAAAAVLSGVKGKTWFAGTPQVCVDRVWLVVWGVHMRRLLDALHVCCG